MKAILMLRFIELVFAVREYGEYRLYRQVGGLLYDYSGNGFFGINGSDLTADSNDALYTDRGMYFNGVNSYIIPHTPAWGSNPTILVDWSISMWIMGIAFGPLFHRISTSDIVSFTFKITGSDVYINGWDCDYGEYRPYTFTQTLPLSKI